MGGKALNMTIEDIISHVEAELEEVNSLMGESLASDINLLNETNGMLLRNRGKQVRPVLAILVAKACGGCCADSLHYAAAAELLHNATLLHDDVADNSPTRRGAPTVMALLGGHASVLLGDYWLVKAMDQIFMAETGGNDVIRSFSRTLSHLAEGEILQLQKANSGDTSEEDYYRIIFSKTASLFVSAAEAAALSARAPESIRKASREYALAMGLAFQVKDDILDYVGSDSLGKPLGQDLKEAKITLPLLGALASVQAEEAEKIRKTVTEAADHPEFIAAIVDFVRTHGGVEYAEAALQRHKKEALKALEAFPPSGARDCLASLAEFITRRDR